jgi:hypothetical protein
MKIVCILLLLLVFSHAFSQDSIFVEKIPKDQLNNEHRFDVDNKIYPLGKEFLFKFSISKNDSILDSEIALIQLNVLGTTKPFSEFDSEYSQTVIQYNYYDKNKKLLLTEKTGLIENNVNIWFHPPRSIDAGILQLAAFPYVKLDSKDKWLWKLDAAFGEYQDVHLTHYYNKENTTQYNSSDLGLLLCKVIKVKTESEIGTTNSCFLYNDVLGFVLLEFFNSDGSKITLTLIN